MEICFEKSKIKLNINVEIYNMIKLHAKQIFKMFQYKQIGIHWTNLNFMLVDAN
jgi:hypothetical protein